MSKVFIHTHALVETDQIGEGTRIWAFVHILKGAVVGNDCNICDHCYIEQGVTIGNHVTVKSGIYIWEGVSIEDYVFLGPNVVFTNDIKPRSKYYKEPIKTLIKKGASIGANSTILAGTIIGEYAMTGIASVITRDVPAHALVYGNPARIKGWVDEKGEPLMEKGNGIWQSDDGMLYTKDGNGGLKRM